MSAGQRQERSVMFNPDGCKNRTGKDSQVSLRTWKANKISLLFSLYKLIENKLQVSFYKPQKVKFNSRYSGNEKNIK